MKNLSNTETPPKTENLTAQLNQVAAQSAAHQPDAAGLQPNEQPMTDDRPEIEPPPAPAASTYDALFERWDERDFTPPDFRIGVPVASLESKVGYSSLLRQLHQSFVRDVAYYTSAEGGLLTLDQARAKAFHACDNKEEAKRQFQQLARMPLENLRFNDLDELYGIAPRVVERFWEKAKKEGRQEFLSGHLGANIVFPVGYLKQVWNIARYLGVRESFIEDWQPKGGIEVALIDMLAQTYFQWQYWLEQTVTRSETKLKEEHPDYQDWQRRRKEFKQESWADGYWLKPTISERAAVEHAVQMADRFHRIFMRTLRQLRDLRRYSPVTINNPKQVNIAGDGGQQINLSKGD